MLRFRAWRQRAAFSDGAYLILIAAGLFLFLSHSLSAFRPQPVDFAPHSGDPAAVAADPAGSGLSRPPPSPAPAVVTRTRHGITYVLDGSDGDSPSTANVDRALSLLSSPVLDALGNRELGPLTVLVNPKGRTLSGSQPYGAAANFYSTNNGVNEVILYPGQSVTTVLHELGHAYNLRHVAPGRYALVVFDPEMQSFMTATGWRLLSPTEDVQQARDQTGLDFAYDGGFTWPRLSHDDPLEDFAASFALYFSDPAALRDLSLARYRWFEANLPR